MDEDFNDFGDFEDFQASAAASTTSTTITSTPSADDNTDSTTLVAGGECRVDAAAVAGADAGAESGVVVVAGGSTLSTCCTRVVQTLGDTTTADSHAASDEHQSVPSSTTECRSPGSSTEAAAVEQCRDIASEIPVDGRRDAAAGDTPAVPMPTEQAEQLSGVRDDGLSTGSNNAGSDCDVGECCDTKEVRIVLETTIDAVVRQQQMDEECCGSLREQDGPPGRDNSLEAAPIDDEQTLKNDAESSQASSASGQGPIGGHDHHHHHQRHDAGDDDADDDDRFSGFAEPQAVTAVAENLSLPAPTTVSNNNSGVVGGFDDSEKANDKDTVAGDSGDDDFGEFDQADFDQSREQFANFDAAPPLPVTTTTSTTTTMTMNTTPPPGVATEREQDDRTTSSSGLPDDVLLSFGPVAVDVFRATIETSFADREVTPDIVDQISSSPTVVACDNEPDLTAFLASVHKDLARCENVDDWPCVLFRYETSVTRKGLLAALCIDETPANCPRFAIDCLSKTFLQPIKQAPSSPSFSENSSSGAEKRRPGAGRPDLAGQRQLSDAAKEVLNKIPDLSFMKAEVLTFPTANQTPLDIDL